MINLEAIFEKQNPQDGKLPEWAKNFALEVCQQVLELAAERATLLIYKENMDNASDNDKMYGKEYYHGQYDLNGSDYHMDIKIHKQSILDVINQVK